MSAIPARISANRFECIVTRGEGAVRLGLRGYLDEDCEFPRLELHDGDAIEIDFAGLLGMDASGVILWEQFLFQHSERVFVFRNCREFVVKSANFFPSFLPANVTVDSFDVKFRCEDCSGSAFVSFVRDRHFAVWNGGYGRLHNGEEAKVCECGTRTRPKMVETEAKYLEFLKRTR